MSREFGSYSAGYFHDQMRYAADDCQSGRDELTRLWGGLLESFTGIAYQIASSEAGDSGPEDTIIQTIQDLPLLQERLAAIEKFCKPFKACMEEAIRAQVNKK